MNQEALIALADKWERESNPPEVEVAEAKDAFEKGMTMGNRVALNRCADDLVKLIKLLGD